MRLVGEEAAFPGVPVGASLANRSDSGERVRLEEEQAVVLEGTMRLAENGPRIGRAEDVEFAEYQHDEAESGSVARPPDVLTPVAAAEVVSAGVVLGVGVGRRGVVDADALMAALGQAARVQPGAATQIEDSCMAAHQQVVVNPVDVSVDGLGAAAGGVVVLRQVLAEHPLAEAGFVPRDVVSVLPGGDSGRPPNEVEQR